MTAINFSIPHIGLCDSFEGWETLAHSHSHVEILVIIRGRELMDIEGHELVAREGTVVFLRPGTRHAERNLSDPPFRSFFLAGEGELPPEVPLSTDDSQGRIRVLCEWLYRDRDSNYGLLRSAPEAFGELFVKEILRLNAPAEFLLVSRTRAYIREHLDEKLTLDRLADQAGISRYHFARRYKELANTTPMQDVRHMRLEKARQLLVTTNLPLKAIAPTVGLSDEYHLSRLFRSEFGTRPSDIRRED